MNLRQSKLGEQSELVREATSGFYNGPFQEKLPEFDDRSLVEIGNRIAAGENVDKDYEIIRVLDKIKAEIVLHEEDDVRRVIAENYLYKLKNSLSGE